jgi:NitT/TauT family transport system ATP-binding protein
MDPILQVQSLTTTFQNGEEGLHVLDNISFDVYPNQFVCILGPSGSGKSTLLRVLAGLLSPSSGIIFFKGAKQNGSRQTVGMVFQNANLMPWRTVSENIKLPLELQSIPSDIAQDKANDLISLVGLQGFENALPRDLSGGMAQRVAIARALIHNPDLLLLDEPFGALDAITRDRMGEELLRIWQIHNKTVIMVTHSISEALYLADRVLVLSERPAHIHCDLIVDLPRPRHGDIRYTSTFGEMARKLRGAIG